MRRSWATSRRISGRGVGGGPRATAAPASNVLELLAFRFGLLLARYAVKGLYVTDSSFFPTNTGVNTQYTIAGLSWGWPRSC
jgi:hypothetical protein